MNEIALDWVESSLFLMIATAEITDHYLDEQEIVEIIEKANVLVSNRGKKEVHFTRKDVEQKFDKVFNWYNDIGDTAPQGLMDEKIMDEVQKSANYLKGREWFNPIFAKSLLSGLIAIADADGEVIEDEISFINDIAKLWGVEPLF